MLSKNYITALLILLQQTNLQPSVKTIPFFNSRLTKIWNLLLCCFAALRYNNVFNKYKKNNFTNANFLANLFKDNEIKSVLDIGCGIAGYHSRWMLVEKGDLYLFDNSTFNISSLRYGMGNSERYYNSLSMAKRFLGNEGIDHSRIHLIEISKEQFNNRKYDLIISFISLGFHYHVSTYWMEIMNSINTNGIIVLDIRNSSSSYEFIEDSKLADTIYIMNKITNGKFTRFTLKKL
jgi:hypothetical protein